MNDRLLGVFELDSVVVGNLLEVLGLLPGDCIDLAVTSPPYFNAREEYAHWPSYEAYLEEVQKWFDALFRVLKPGRRLVWNIQNLPATDGLPRLLPLYADSLFHAQKAGFIYRNTIYWNDPADARIPEPGSFPNGPSVLMKENLEQLLVMQKPVPPGYKKKSYPKLSDELKPFNEMDTDFYRDRVVRQVWDIHPVVKINSKGENTFGHPAPFPEDLVEPCIRMWSRPEEIVLDPFMGSGTTALSAMKWRRHYFGCDLSADYVRLANRRIERREMELLTRQLVMLPI